jgi:peptidyl-prolyl cis-trans isomerase D
VRAQHILVKTDSRNPESEKTAESKVKDLLEKAKSQDFGKLASEFSEDSGSKINNGDLGFFAKGMMTPAFEAAAFGAEVGKVIGPIKTPFGFHLIKVNEVKDAEPADFEKSKLQIAKSFVQEDAYDKSIADLENLLKEGNSEKLDSWIKSYHLKWEETPLAELGSESLGALSSSAAKQSLADLGPKQKILPRVVRDGDQRFVLALKEIKIEKDSKPQDPKLEVIGNRSMEVLNLWLEDQRKRAKVEINLATTGN